MTYTTYEQSKRLVACGLDYDSADMIYIRNGYKPMPNEKYYRQMAELPCWSLGHLWITAAGCVSFQFDDTDMPDDIVEALVRLCEDEKNTRRHTDR